MNFEKTVKLINFQSLLKIKATKNKVNVYQNVTNEVIKVIKNLIYNKNLDFDKSLLSPDKTKPKLNIYIANDYGLCGNYNSPIIRRITECLSDYKIIIGKKIFFDDDKTLLKIKKENFQDYICEVDAIIAEGLKNMAFSEINLYYIHYYNFTEFDLKKIHLFPIDIPGEYFNGSNYILHTKLDEMLKELISFYISYQIQIAKEISVASENSLKKQITTMSLDRLDAIKKQKHSRKRREKDRNNILKNVKTYMSNMEDNYEQ